MQLALLFPFDQTYACKDGIEGVQINQAHEIFLLTILGRI